NTNFNDAAFTDAMAPFWYDTTGDTSTRVGGTQLVDMPNNYSCLFLRRTFIVNNAAAVGALKWDAFIDDGYIAWINGVEVFRENVSGDQTRLTLAAGVAEPIPVNSMTRYPVTGLLHNGTNWLTVQVFNTTLGSSDIDFDCALSTIIGETIPPTITSFSPPAGTRTELTSITVNFPELVQGVTADDLQLNFLPASAVSGGGSNYTFTFAQPQYGTVDISWFTNHGITDLSLPP